MKNFIQIYRLENANGVGPYFHNATDYRRNTVHSYMELALIRCGQDPEMFNNSDRHPTPIRDSLLKNDSRFIKTVGNSRYRCGFRNIAQFKKWFRGFPDVIIELEKMGIRLVEYTVSSDKVIVGKTQILMSVSKRTKVQRVALSPVTLQEYPF